MLDPLIILTFIVGLSVSVFSGIVGAGGGLLSTPYLVLIGIPPLQAVATPKLLGFGLGVGSIKGFHGNNKIDWKAVRLLLPIGLFASSLGSVAVLEVSQSAIKPIVAVITLTVAIGLFFDKRTGESKVEVTRINRIVGGFIFAATDFLRGAFGSGIGTLNMAVFMKFFGLDAITANAVKRIVTFPSFFVGIMIFSYNDAIRWDHGAALLLGGVIGGFIGSKIAIKQGNVFVKRMFMVSVIVMALSLLFV